MATISDICKATGFSKATVSRVINNNPSVKPATRDIVIKAMESVGYYPNPVAQSLATSRSNTIGLILPHFYSYYFGTIMKTVAAHVQKANKKLLVMDSHNTKNGELDALKSLVSQKCASIMIYSRHLSEADLVEFYNSTDIPLIVINRQLQSKKLASFGFNQFELGYLATEHLIKLGHRDIACISNPLNSQTGKSRLNAYKACLEESHIPFNENLIIEGTNEMESGYTCIKTLLRRNHPFSALFCCTDDMALGAIRALHEKKLSVPKDVSVVGIDNEPNSAFSVPGISTVSLPIEELTADAINLAISHTSSLAAGTILHRDYSGTLITRESSDNYPK